LEESKNILICPLEWGLGHAARMVPLARRLQEMNHNVFIGSGENLTSLFRNELSGVSYIDFPGFKVVFSRYLPQYLHLLTKIPLFLYHTFKEHYKLKRIIRENSIDIVISDNRFGLWNSTVTTVYVTHLPLIPFPKAFRFLEFIGIWIHRATIKKFTYCFIPDLPGELNLSGRLSHGMKLPSNVRYIGILSRFLNYSQDANENPAPFLHNTVILSGPEPQRGILKQKLIDILKDREPVTVILEGKPGKVKTSSREGNIVFYNHLPTTEMINMIKGSELVISRSGYTTIMDLINLNHSALLIPTPGQNEQEYLAEYLSGKGWFTTVLQSDLKSDFSPVINKVTWSGEIVCKSKTLFNEALRELLEHHHKAK
jgi:UDP-N-acetylglucosamine transferase subunit ALG13